MASETATIDKSGERVQRMFAEIAPRYDLLNHTLSLHVDRYWRWKSLGWLTLEPGLPVLDVCTGTGDLALAMSKRLGSDTEVVGSDFCAPMLEIARHKQERQLRDHSQLRFVEADTMQLPFESDYFSVVTVAFGLRNVSDTMAGLREMLRVTRPGGQIAILEFSKPTAPGLKQFYDFYFRSVLPRIGNTVAKNSSDAYRYLPESVSQFPSGEELAKWMREVGMESVRWHAMTLGAVTLYLGHKPASAGI
ncbi:MAG: bifunctional demethylmenaquinone methyltransferase/2-methoxy-6-polyprenyl-1,4-benzoquinol methylase UbiE [Planctomycetota bacterium]